MWLARRLQWRVIRCRRTLGKLRRYLVALRTVQGLVVRIGFAGLMAGALGIAVGRGVSSARVDFLVVTSADLPGQFVVLGNAGNKFYAAGFDRKLSVLTNQIAIFETGDRTLRFTYDALGPLDPYGAVGAPSIAQLFRVLFLRSNWRERPR